MAGALYASRAVVEQPHSSIALVERSSLPIAELEGPHHIVRQANAGFCRLIGKAQNAVIGQPYAEVMLDKSSLVVIDRVYRTGSCELHNEQEKTTGQPVGWCYAVWPVLDTANRPLSVIIQVTEQKSFRQLLRAMTEALMIAVVEQHERTDVAEALNVRLEAEISERKRVEAALSKSDARFRSLVAMSSDWYWEQDACFRFTEVNEASGKEANVVPADWLGKTYWEIPSSGLGKEQWAEHRELLRQHRPFRKLEYQCLDARGTNIWISINGDPVFDRTGKFCGYRGTGRDISERKRHEEQIELIMREVSHREKNVLSLVLAVARQTADATPEHFLERFSARLRSIAANQDLLVKNQWRGIEMDELVRSQLSHFQDLADTRIHLRGPVLRLRAGAAQIIGMSIHELATNAGKYGALANCTGNIDLTWRLHEEGGERRFSLSWVEQGGPPTDSPKRRGFGSTVVGKMARVGLGANISHEFPSTGVRWTLDCPASRILE